MEKATKLTIQKAVEISTAHRQYGDTSKCGFLHGHNWIVTIRVSGPVNDLGYIIDFKDIKDLVERMDHKVLLHHTDPLVKILLDAGQKVYELPLNPTCENIACYLIQTFQNLYPEMSFEVKVTENSNASAEIK